MSSHPNLVTDLRASWKSQPTHDGQVVDFHPTNQLQRAEHNFNQLGQRTATSGTTCLRHPPRAVWVLPGLTASRCAALYIGKQNQQTLCLSIPQNPNSSPLRLNPETLSVCTGFIIWCLLSGFIKTWKEKMAGKGPANSLPVHHCGSRFLPGRSGNTPTAQSPGTRQAFEPAALRRQLSSCCLRGSTPRLSSGKASFPGS